MRILTRLAPLALVPLTSACMVAAAADAVVDVATLPVKAVGKAYDVATTSQAEADQNRGRAMREAEEKYGKALEKWEKDCARAERRGDPCPDRPTFEAPR